VGYRKYIKFNDLKVNIYYIVLLHLYIFIPEWCPGDKKKFIEKSNSRKFIQTSTVGIASDTNEVLFLCNLIQ